MSDDFDMDIDGFEGDTFEGTVEKVETVKGRNPDFPDTIHIVLSVSVEFMDNPYEISIPFSRKKESVMGHWLEALKSEAGLKIKRPEDLTGLQLRFERRPVILRGGFEARKSMPIPIENLG